MNWNVGQNHSLVVLENPVNGLEMGLEAVNLTAVMVP
jgi:hypothetical protein